MYLGANISNYFEFANNLQKKLIISYIIYNIKRKIDKFLVILPSRNRLKAA